MKRYTIAPLAALVACALAQPAAGQPQNPPQTTPPVLRQRGTTPATPTPVQTFQDTRVFGVEGGAQMTRMELMQVLRRLPPSVGEVLQRDPSLLNVPEYLAPYPQLVAFLQQHPEIARNPSFYFGTYTFPEPNSSDRAYNVLGDLLSGIAVFGVVTIVLTVLGWIVRTVIDHRRWLRLTRTQAEVHTKLLDRLTANEDLLAYIQSPSGRRFLESAPIAINGEVRPAGAPLGRIILSLQAGVVLIALGLGLWFVQRQVADEIAEGFSIIGTIVFSLGSGFAASALVAYAVSSKLGLVARAKPAQPAHE